MRPEARTATFPFMYSLMAMTEIWRMDLKVFLRCWRARLLESKILSM